MDVVNWKLHHHVLDLIPYFKASAIATLIAKTIEYRIDLHLKPNQALVGISSDKGGNVRKARGLVLDAEDASSDCFNHDLKSIVDDVTSDSGSPLCAKIFYADWQASLYLIRCIRGNSELTVELREVVSSLSSPSGVCLNSLFLFLASVAVGV